ncbi:MAG: hypothetical protein GY705_03185 [Bacteroidetes bacterium]|nr:hypothetical protein [Bacteroidota bacterium]
MEINPEPPKPSTVEIAYYQTPEFEPFALYKPISTIITVPIKDETE